jgi:hypothetical protein
MKISLALGPRQPPSRQTARGCLAANLAFPGSGSLAAGRRSGYLQLALALGSLALTLIAFARFVAWYSANSARFDEADALDKTVETLRAMRGPLLGLALFAVSWLWALGTSLAVLGAAKEAEARRIPPRLH